MQNANHRLANLRVGLIELAKCSEHAEAHAADAAPREILRESLQQSVAIFCTILAALLEFDDVGADEPVAEDEALVDRRRRAPDRRRVGLGDGRQELALQRSKALKPICSKW